tara:strand:- start:51 stop:437 length:387 start_codon:yes stop_codon:yes gene_type:complete
MWRVILFVIAALNFALAAYMWFAPLAWYDGTPGVAMMGPFNLHFIRDVALAYLTSAAALSWGAWKRDIAAAVFGAAWPCFHALFHIWIWLGRGVPFDQIALVNLLGIQIPAWLALAAALSFTERRATR